MRAFVLALILGVLTLGGLALTPSQAPAREWQSFDNHDTYAVRWGRGWRGGSHWRGWGSHYYYPAYRYGYYGPAYSYYPGYTYYYPSYNYYPGYSSYYYSPYYAYPGVSYYYGW